MNRHRFWLSAAALLAPCFALTSEVAQAQRATVGTSGVSTSRVSSVSARGTPMRLATNSRPRSSAKVVQGQHSISPDGLFGSADTGAFGLLSPGFASNNFSKANQDLWIKAAIDPATQWRLFERQRFHRNHGFGAAGFYWLDGGPYYEPAEPAEAEQAPSQQPAPPAQAEFAEAASAERLSAPQTSTSVPVEDVGQFVLVLRNGSQLQTVAFTRSNDHIVYVTTDGFRRTLALSDLDTGATIRINEERGTPLEIPL